MACAAESRPPEFKPLSPPILECVSPMSKSSPTFLCSGDFKGSPSPKRPYFRGVQYTLNWASPLRFLRYGHVGRGATGPCTSLVKTTQPGLDASSLLFCGCSPVIANGLGVLGGVGWYCSGAQSGLSQPMRWPIHVIMDLRTAKLARQR
jgi:hypothetical protein